MILANSVGSTGRQNCNEVSIATRSHDSEKESGEEEKQLLCLCYWLLDNALWQNWGQKCATDFLEKMRFLNDDAAGRKFTAILKEQDQPFVDKGS